MSTYYCLVLAAGPLLRSLGHVTSFKPLYFLKTLSSLISLTFWWPLCKVDGHDAFNYVHGHDQHKYHTDMQFLATKFISAITTECTLSEIVRSRLDKPNIHRLLELYHSTIPRFTHVMFFFRYGVREEPPTSKVSPSKQHQ